MSGDPVTSAYRDAVAEWNRVGADLAVDYLRNALALGPRPTSEVEREAPPGVTDHLLRQARERLGVRAFQRGRRWWLALGQAGDAPLTPRSLEAPEDRDSTSQAGAVPMEPGPSMEVAEGGDVAMERDEAMEPDATAAPPVQAGRLSPEEWITVQRQMGLISADVAFAGRRLIRLLRDRGDAASRNAVEELLLGPDAGEHVDADALREVVLALVDREHVDAPRAREMWRLRNDLPGPTAGELDAHAYRDGLAAGWRPDPREEGWLPRGERGTWLRGLADEHERVVFALAEAQRTLGEFVTREAVPTLQARAAELAASGAAGAALARQVAEPERAQRELSAAQRERNRARERIAELAADRERDRAETSAQAWRDMRGLTETASDGLIVPAEVDEAAWRRRLAEAESALRSAQTRAFALADAEPRARRVLGLRTRPQPADATAATTTD